jgi:hypothetical protein
MHSRKLNRFGFGGRLPRGKFNCRLLAVFDGDGQASIASDVCEFVFGSRQGRFAGLTVHLTQHLCLREHKTRRHPDEEKPRQDEALYEDAADNGEHAEGKLSSES